MKNKNQIVMAIIDGPLSRELKKENEIYIHNLNQKKDINNVTHGDINLHIVKKIIGKQIQIEYFNITCDYNENKVDLTKTIEALKMCLENKVDVICINASFCELNYKLEQICNNLYENGVYIFCATYDDNNRVEYPSAFQSTIKIVINNLNKNIYFKESKEISLSEEFQNRYWDIDYTGYFPNIKGACFATSIVASKYALILKEKPILTRCQAFENLLKENNIFKVEDTLNLDDYFNQVKLPKKSLILLYCEKILEYELKKIVIDEESVLFNVNDITREQIIRECKENKYTNIIHLNGNHYPINQIDLAEVKINQLYYGNFNNIKEKITWKRENENIEKMLYTCEAPIVAITSFTPNSMKFYLQFKLKEKLENYNLNVLNFSYNPMVLLYEGGYFDYKKEVIIPDSIYYLNNVITNLARKKRSDIITLNLPNGVSKINNEEGCLGKSLFEVYQKAFCIDVVIICITPDLDFEELIKSTEFLLKEYECIFAISKYRIDPASYNENYFSFIKSDNIYIELLKNQIRDKGYKAYEIEKEYVFILDYILSILQE